MLQRVLHARDEAQKRSQHPAGCLPVLVKIAPDLTREEKIDIAQVILDTGVDGLVVSNTTISRSSTLKSEYKEFVYQIFFFFNSFGSYKKQKGKEKKSIYAIDLSIPPLSIYLKKI